jgi:hypothetical protein
VCSIGTAPSIRQNNTSLFGTTPPHGRTVGNYHRLHHCHKRDQRKKSTDQAHGRYSETKEHHRLRIVVVAVCFLARGVVKVVELSARGDPGGGHFFETLACLCFEGFHRIKLVNQTLKGCVRKSYFYVWWISAIRCEPN